MFPLMVLQMPIYVRPEVRPNRRGRGDLDSCPFAFGADASAMGSRPGVKAPLAAI